jgi:hypothetical protein
MSTKNYEIYADDDCRVSDRDAATYLGFRSTHDIRVRVDEGSLRLAERRDGKAWFRLGDLRDYSRNTAVLSQPGRAMGSA